MEKEKLIFIVDFDEKDSQKKLKALQKESEALRNEQGRLAAQIKVAGTATTEQSSKMSGLENAIKSNSKSQNKLNAELAAASKVAAYNAEITRKQKESTEKYSSAVVDSIKSVNILGVSVGDLTNRAEGGLKGFINFSKGIFTTKGALTALTALPIIAFLTGIIALLQKTEKGQEFLQKSMAAGSAVLDVLISKLIGFSENVMKVFQEPGKAVQQFTGYLTDLGERTLSNLISGFKGLGTSVSLLFKGQFSEAAKVAGESLLKLNPASAVMDDVAGAVKGLVKETIDAAGNAVALEEKIIALTKASRDYEVQIARLNAEFEKQSAIADDNTRSFDEREKAAEKARIAAEKASALQVSLAQQELNIINAKILTNKKLGTSDKELLDKQKEARLKLIEAQNQYQKTSFENEKQRRELQRDAFEQELDYLIDGFDNQKTINERKLADDKLTIEAKQKILDETVRLGKKSFDEQIKQVEEYSKAKINADELINESDAKSLKKKVDALNLDEITANRLLEIIKERKTALSDLNQAQEDLNKEAYDRQNAELDTFFKNQETILEENKNKRLISENEYQAGLIAIQKMKIDTEAELNRQAYESGIISHQEFINKEAEIFAEQVQNEKDSNDLKIKNRKEYEEAVFSISQNVADTFGKLGVALAGNAEKAKDIQKLAAIAQLTIDTAKIISSIATEATIVSGQIAISSGAAGVVTGPAAYAIIISKIASVLANVATAKAIISQAGGGGDFVTTKPTMLLVGESGPERVNVTPLTSKGKTIVHPESGLIQMGGGGSLTVGGQSLSPLQVPQAIEMPKNTLGTGITPIFDYNELAKAMSNLEIITDVRDVTKAQNKISIRENRADF